MTKEQYHQGAKVRRRYFIESTEPVVETRLDGTSLVRSQAYQLATANPRKSWAKRYLKQRRYL